MKIAKLLIPVLLGLGLFGCGEQKITGLYMNPEEGALTIDQEGERYIVNTNVIVHSPYSDRESRRAYKAVTYRKDNTLYNMNDNSVVGKIDKTEFTLTRNGKTYKRER